jgi:hypothetical protein
MEFPENQPRFSKFFKKMVVKEGSGGVGDT